MHCKRRLEILEIFLITTSTFSTTSNFEVVGTILRQTIFAAYQIKKYKHFLVYTACFQKTSPTTGFEIVEVVDVVEVV